MRRNQGTCGFAALGLAICGAVAWSAQTPPESEKPEQEDSGASDSAAADRKPAQDQTPAAGRQPSAEDIMKAFSRDRPVNRPVSPVAPSATPPSDASGGDSRMLLREGDFVNRQIGRLEREGPWWTLVLNSDSSESPHPPMRLLPNRQLERMVRETEASDESALYEVSGEITLFESQNYLLVRKSMRFRTTANLDK